MIYSSIALILVSSRIASSLLCPTGINGNDLLQGNAMCYLAEGFAPLPVGLTSTWTRCNASNNPTVDYCSWAGVACDPGCHVTALTLGNAGISGSISSYIGQLTNLQGLFLYQNSLTGVVPTEIALLSQLQYLAIDSNQLTGFFPDEICNGVLSSATPPHGVPLGLVQLQLFQADNNNFACMPSCLYKAKPQNYGLYGMAIWTTLYNGGIYIDQTVPMCGTHTPTRAPTLSVAPSLTKQPTFTRAPSTAYPSKTPTTPAQFKWQAGVYWTGGGINVGTTYMYNLYYGNWAMTAAGTYSNAATAAIIDQFCVDQGKPGNTFNTWYSIMNTYWDSSTQVPMNSTLVGSYFVNSTNYPVSINQYDLEVTILGANIKAGIVPAEATGKNCYNIFPSEDVKVDKVQTGYATADCSSVCGFHSYTTVKKGTISYRIQYTIQANQASKNSLPVQCGCTWYGSGLTQKSPNGNYIADSFIYILSHEIAELVTDSSRGWNNCPGCTGENGDLCIWRPGTDYTGDFLYRPVVNSFGFTVYGNMVGASGRVYHVNPTWVNYGQGCCSVSWPFEKDKGQLYQC